MPAMRSRQPNPRNAARAPMRLLIAPLLALTAWCAPPLAQAQTATVPSTPLVTPAVKAGSTTTFTARVRWNNPAGIDNVRIRARAESATAWLPGENGLAFSTVRTEFILGDQKLIIDAGLTPGAVYEVQVAARKSGVWGGWSGAGSGRAGKPSDLLAGELSALEVADAQADAAVVFTPDFDAAVFTYRAFFRAAASAASMTVEAANEASIKVLGNCAGPPCTATSETTPNAEGVIALGLERNGSRDISIAVTPVLSADKVRTYALQLNHTPAPPQDFTATASTDRPDPRLTLNWTRAPILHASAYNVHIKDADTANWPANDGGLDSFPAGLTFAEAPAPTGEGENWSAVIMGAETGESYDVRVAGADGDRSGAFSETRQVRVAVTVPSAPRNVALQPGAGFLRVDWDAPESGTAGEYRVRWAVESAPQTYINSGGADGIATTNRSRSILSLTDGIPYLVEVAGVNNYGTGAWSAAVRGVPSSLALTSAPPDLKLYAEAAAPAAPAFPAAQGGSEPYAYAVSGLPSGLVFDAATRILSGTPGAVTALTEYPATYSVTDSGLPGVTRTRSFRIMVAPAPALTGTTSFSGLSVDVATLTSLPSVVGGFEPYTHSLTGTPSNFQFDTSNPITPSLLVNSALAGVFTGTYSVRDSLGSTAEVMVSYEFVGRAPGVPGNLAARTTGVSGELQASWEKPASAGGVPPAALTYMVRWAADGAPSAYLNTNEADGVTADSAAAHTITGLTDATVYRVEVSASNEFGSGAWSAHVSAAPSTLQFTQHPDLRFYSGTALSGVTMAEASGGTATYAYTVTGTLPTGLSFTAATRVLSGTPSAEFSGMIEYTVEDSAASPASRTDFLAIQVALPPELGENTYTLAADAEADIELLAVAGGYPPYAYKYTGGALPAGLTLSADNRRLQGIPREFLEEAHALSRSVTDDLGASADGEEQVNITIAVPQPPDNFTAATWSADGLELSWDAPIATGGVGADALRYEVRWKSAAAADYDSGDSADIAAGVTERLLEPLPADRSHDVQVRSVNDEGMSDWTAAARATSGARYTLGDVDGTGVADFTWQEGVLITRGVLGVRGTALAAGLGYDDAAAVAEAAAASIETGIASGRLDVNGDGAVTGADGILIARKALGVTGGALTEGQADSSKAGEVEGNIDALLP